VAQTLTRHERIRTRREFRAIQQLGVRLHSRYMTLIVMPNGLDVSRLGIIASRRVGGAVRRNRAKRLARELFRRNKTDAGLDIVVVPRPEFPDAAFSVLDADYRAALRRHTRRR